MNWIDLGLIILLAIFIIIGIKKGFMTSVLSNFSFGVVVIIAFFLCKPISSLLNSIFGLEKNIYNTHLTDLIASNSNFSVNLLGLTKEALPSFVKLTLAESTISPIPRIMFNIFLNKSTLYTTLHESTLTSRTLGEIVASSYASFYTKIISFAITVGLIYLVLFLFRLLIKKLRENGFVKTVDTIFGVIYSIAHFLIVMLIICLVFNLLGPFKFMNTVENYINGSFFGKLIYSQVNNLINNYFHYEDLILLIFG